MKKKNNAIEQLSLFEETSSNLPPRKPQLRMSKTSLIRWKQRIFKHQSQISNQPAQLSLFDETKNSVTADDINPLELPLHNSLFWRNSKFFDPNDPNNKGCLYFVIDNSLPIILYIGETKITPRQRWTGVHDCKAYTVNYIQQHRKYKLDCQVCTSFFLDVPPSKKVLLEWEKYLIIKWQPPFNKEMWHLYSQPFGKQL